MKKLNKTFLTLFLLLGISMATVSHGDNIIDSISVKQINLNSDVRTDWPNKHIINFVVNGTILAGNTYTTITNVFVPSAGNRRILCEITNTNLAPYSQYYTVNVFDGGNIDGTLLVNSGYYLLSTSTIASNYPSGTNTINVVNSPLGNNSLVRIYSGNTNQLNRVSSTNTVIASINTNVTSITLTNESLASTTISNSTQIITNGFTIVPSLVDITTNFLTLTSTHTTITTNLANKIVTNGTFNNFGYTTNVNSIAPGNIYTFANFFNNIFVADGPIIYKSSDGRNWNVAENSFVSDVKSLCVYSGNLYAGSTNSVFVTTDSSGQNWTASAPTLSGTGYINTMIVYSNILYAGASGIIYTYDNASWSVSTNGLSGNVTDFHVYSNTLYTTCGNTVYKYSGLGWTNVYTVGGNVFSCLTDYQNKLYVGSSTGNGRFYSYDNTNWSTVSNGVSVYVPGNVYAFGKYNGSLIIGSFDGGGNNRVTLFDGTTFYSSTTVSNKIYSFGNFVNYPFDNYNVGENITPPLYMGTIGTIYQYDGYNWKTLVGTDSITTITTNNLNIPFNITSTTTVTMSNTVNNDYVSGMLGCIYNGKYYSVAISQHIYAWDGISNGWTDTGLNPAVDFPNGQVQSICTFNNKLYVVTYASVGGYSTKFWRYDGVSWTSSYNSTTVGNTGQLTVYNNKLYYNNGIWINIFDGNSWNTTTNPIVTMGADTIMTPMTTYDGKLYGIEETRDDIHHINVYGVYSFDGKSWDILNTNIIGNIGSSGIILNMLTYDNNLYMIVNPAYTYQSHLIKFDGSSWSVSSNYLGANNATDVYVYNGKLMNTVQYFVIGNSSIWGFDGTSSWSNLFSQTIQPPFVYNNTLYSTIKYNGMENYTAGTYLFYTNGPVTTYVTNTTHTYSTNRIPVTVVLSTNSPSSLITNYVISGYSTNYMNFDRNIQGISSVGSLGSSMLFKNARTVYKWDGSSIPTIVTNMNYNGGNTLIQGVVYSGKLYITDNDSADSWGVVWSTSDGITWNVTTNGLTQSAGGILSLLNYGGYLYGSSYYGGLWKFDGSVWGIVTNTGGSASRLSTVGSQLYFFSLFSQLSGFLYDGSVVTPTNFVGGIMGTYGGNIYTSYGTNFLTGNGISIYQGGTNYNLVTFTNVVNNTFQKGFCSFGGNLYVMTTATQYPSPAGSYGNYATIYKSTDGLSFTTVTNLYISLDAWEVNNFSYITMSVNDSGSKMYIATYSWPLQNPPTSTDSNIFTYYESSNGTTWTHPLTAYVTGTNVSPNLVIGSITSTNITIITSTTNDTYVSSTSTNWNPFTYVILSTTNNTYTNVYTYLPPTTVYTTNTVSAGGFGGGNLWSPTSISITSGIINSISEIPTFIGSTNMSFMIISPITTTNDVHFKITIENLK